MIHFECDYGILQSFFEMGAVMMTGFFTLSGFSLSYSYSMKDFGEWGNIKNFYKKRVVGILPAYYFVYIDLLYSFSILHGNCEANEGERESCYIRNLYVCSFAITDSCMEV